MYSQDIGPGNCLIDQWIRHNSDKKYDNIQLNNSDLDEIRTV